MGSKNFTITGRVIDSQTSRGIAGLLIEIWDKDRFFDDFIGKAVTEVDGTFAIRFNDTYFRERHEQWPDLYFRLYSDGEPVAGNAYDVTVTPPNGKVCSGTGEKIFWKLDPGHTEVLIKAALPASVQSYKISGTLVMPDGSPVSGAIVRVFDENIAVEILLGETITDAAGHYELTFTAESFSGTGKKAPDLIVRTFNQQGEAIASTPKPLYNAGQREEVNLVFGNEAYRGPSKYDQLLAVVLPLVPDDIEPADLTEKQIVFLVNKTGITTERINQLVLATRYAKKSDLPAEVYFGLFQQNFPTNLPALLAQQPEQLTRAMESAVTENIIPALSMTAEEVLEKFTQLVVADAFTPLEPLPMGKTTIGQLIGTVEMDPELHRVFLQRYITHQGTVEAFWEELRNDNDFSDAVPQLQYTLQLGALTGNHLPLVEHLQQVESITKLQYFAALNLDDWKALAGSVPLPPDVPGKNDQEKTENYARTMARMIEDAFPTAVFAHKLQRDTEFTMPFREQISAFLLDPQGFELGSTQIDEYVNLHPNAFSGEEEIHQLKIIDRLFRICPRFDRYESMKVLMESGFHSARRIAMMGQRNFCSRFAEQLGNFHKAKVVYTNACQVSAMALMLQSKYNSLFNQPGLAVLTDISQKTQGIPDWEQLFGTFNLCDCKHCKSVYSPSAYLVDLLFFLRHHELELQLTETDSQINPALDILTNIRRPDIKHINLSCTNADNLLPYVDLVNEIFENAVSYNPEYYQTTNDVDELAANPEHLNINAYKILAETVYPWSLPFDLGTEEARIYLNHLGVPRYALMTAFRKSGDPIGSESYSSIAAEYLGMTIFEWQIIAGETSHTAKEFWGINEEDWINQLSHVPMFLEKSKLTYDELNQLLNTRFINPARFTASAPEPDIDEISIVFPDSFCNVGEAVLENLDQDALDRLHRFVCLWRKLGWTTRELDIALNTLSSAEEYPQIDTSFLLKLWQVQRLHIELKIPLIPLLSFWAPIDTCNYKGKERSLYDQLFLNKAVLNPEDEIFFLNDDRNELNNPNDRLSDHAGSIEAAIQITDQELAGLIHEQTLFFVPLNEMSHDYLVAIREALNNGEVSQELKREFNNHGFSFLNTIHVSVLTEDEHWLVTTVEKDNDASYGIRKEWSDLVVYGYTILEEVLVTKLTTELKESLNQSEITKELRELFASYGIILSTHAHVWLAVENKKWLISDPENKKMYTLVGSTAQPGMPPAEAELAVFNTEIKQLFSVNYEREFISQLNNGNLPEQLATLFHQNQNALSDNAQVIVESFNHRWLITDHEYHYMLRKKGGHIDVSKVDVVPDNLNLSNLSCLFRIVTFARALKLPIKDFLAFRTLIGFDPFDFSPLDASFLFAEKIRRIRESGFTVAELRYLLQHIYQEAEGIAPLTDTVGRVLTEIRDGLQQIDSENSMVADPSGEHTAAGLAAVKWDESLIDEVIGTLNNSRDFSVELSALPSDDFEFPQELGNRIFFDADQGKLHFSGLMSGPERETLLAQSGHKKYQKAIRDLFDISKTFIAERLKAYTFPPISVDVGDFPPEPIVPEGLQKKFYYDKRGGKLFLIGWMTAAERETLIDLFPDYADQIDQLFKSPHDFIVEPDNIFLGKNEIEELLKASDVAGRFDLVLEKLLDHICTVQGINFITRKIADELEVDPQIARELLTNYCRVPADYTTGSKVIDILTTREFASSNPNIDITAASFPEQFAAYILLHKITLIIKKLGAIAEDLPLLFQKNPDVWNSKGWVDLNFLPLSQQQSTSELYEAIDSLSNLFLFKNKVAAQERTLFETLDMAFRPDSDALHDFQAALAQYTDWDLDDLRQLTEWFAWTLEDFQNARTLVRLQPCFSVLKRLGVSAEDACGWLSPPEAPETAMDKALQTARSIKQAAKAKYDNKRWLKLAKPLRDALREKQRSSLVSYLIAHYSYAGRVFENSNDLYAHFLIDPEMNPCMMTSRIKLATSTVQLFIQRCLMNLETWKIPDAITAQEWKKQWQWMKNYRVWEANRKIFLYPENWIEPELRDDKSPFFKDLENELLQNEVTAEHVEKIFLNYLEKLDDVARLEICGMYHEVEKEGPDNIGKNVIDTLHVFGRTRGLPHIYYYRRRVANGGETMYWTPWERVDLDIEGDHLIPVVWNRRLYLFWPIFTEKTMSSNAGSVNQDGAGGNQNGQQGTNGTNPDVDSQEPDSGTGIPYRLDALRSNRIQESEKYWEIQIAWSEHRNGKWSVKKMSNKIIDISKVAPGLPIENPPFEWDKKQFYFITLVENQHLVITCNISDPCSLNYSYKAASFRLTGCNDVDEVIYHTYYDDQKINELSYLRRPESTIVEFMTFLGKPYQNDKFFLQLYSGNFESFEEPNIVLWRIPGNYTVLPPHHDPYFLSQDSFFFQDHTRTFFVTPHGMDVSDSQNPPDVDYPDQSDLPEWYNSNKIQPEQVDRLFPDYYQFIPQYEYWENLPSPSIEIDPPVIETTYPAGAYDEGMGGPPLHAHHGLNSTIVSSTGGETSTTLDYSASWAKSSPDKTYRFEGFYHPYICEFVKHLNHEGIDGLLQREVQLLTSDYFAETYQPTDVVEAPYPREEVNFKTDDSYSLYNWEIFFHAPLMIADRLSKEQRFAEAQKWFHYIFDPTDTSTYDVPNKYWKLRPFFEAVGENGPETLEDLLTREQEELEQQVNAWINNPFNPHLIARMRIVAYQKTVVMKYIDNLIAWGDQLFRRDSIESINEATQLYVLAAEVLGRRPEDIPPHVEAPVKTFSEIENEDSDAFSNAVVATENYLFSPSKASPVTGINDLQIFGPSLYPCCSSTETDQDGAVLYFCIPKNQKLFSYWDTIADRLFKIRHCINIEGVARQLPLFEPPIEPGLLVRAVAAGVDIGSAINDLNAPLPYYRFQFVLQKAVELCADVRTLGASLLSALEKKDAEELAMLRSSHEVQLLKAIRQIKKQQIDEALETINATKKSLQVVLIRYDYYKNIERLNNNERLHLRKLASSQILQSIGQGYEVAASIAHLIPDTTAGVCAGTTYGGTNIGNAFHVYSGFYSFLAAIESYHGNRASITGNQDRRWNEWKLQEKMAEKDIEQLEQQIIAAEIRKAIAENDLENHDLQIENAKEINTLMKDKFTNQELYSWMVSHISTTYFQSYQMAYDMAKRAEKAFCHELGDLNAGFINFGYWDNLKKGLLAGEHLHHDLKRMEVAYLEKNKREFELSKHVSLAMLDPYALIALKETGECFIDIPEALFDLDYPGHYMRRIKSVSLTIPCVTGPYTNVNCTLTLLNNSIRTSSVAADDGDYLRKEDDPRFRDNIGAIQSIATSSGQNDSGVFELNFRDERYLPFEGAGVISSWRLQMPKQFEQFDYSTISDVIIHMKYTAREGGAQLKEIVENGLQERLNQLVDASGETGLFRAFSIRHEFPGAWQSLKQNNSASFVLGKQHLPFFVQKYGPSIVGVTWLAQLNTNANSFKMSILGRDPFTLNQDPNLNNLYVGTSQPINLDEDFTLEAMEGFSLDTLEELVLLVNYTLE